MKTLLTALLALLPAAAAAAPAYVLEATVKLGAPDRWDYVTYDAAANHVLVAHSTETTVIDAATRQVIAHLGPLNGAHGQVVTPDGHVFADSGTSGSVSVFDGATHQPVRTVAAGQDADAVAYDPASRLVVVADGDPGTATLIDSMGVKPSKTVALGGSPESLVADGQGRVFINIADKGELVRMVDGQVQARFPLPGCQSPHGLAIDTRQALLFTSCRNAKLIVVDGNSGAIRQTFDIGQGTDSAAFDATRGRAFSANGDGTLSVFQETGGTVRKLEDVVTAPGARTMAVDPASGRVFLVTADVQDKLKADGPRFSFRPGTVKLLIFKPTGAP